MEQWLVVGGQFSAINVAQSIMESAGGAKDQ